MFRTIAITTDFSETSRAPFAAAAALARKFDARLHLVHVAKEPPLVTPWQMASEPAETSRKRLDALRRKLQILAGDAAEFRGLRVEPSLLEGDPAEALDQFLDRTNVDLLVIATHGFSGIDHFQLGSFTSRTIQIASCPVLVFRAAGAGATDARNAKDLKDARREFRPSRILAPHDFSGPSVAALDVARGWAMAFDAPVKVLHVVETPPPIEGSAGAAVDEIPEVFEDHRNEALAELRKLLGADWKGIDAEAGVRVGHPVIEILEEARSFRADLIIMASRGLSIFDRILLGSVADRVIHGASCPVLVVRR